MDPANTRLSSLLLLISLMLPVLAFGQVAKKVAQASFPSVVLVVMEDGRGHPLGLASGFFVNRDIIATNAHVIQGASRAYARRIGDKIKYDVRSIVALDEARDLALLQLEKATGTPLTLGDSDRLAVGDEVFAVGNPQGLEGTFSQGIVSGVRAVKGMSLLQITAPISPGSSGGPVLNAQAEVIGVAVATFRDGQNLNFAVPAKYLMALMSEPANPRSLQSYEKASGSRALLNDLGGEKDTEGVEGTNFRWDSDSGVFSFSLANKLREPVRNVYCLVIFYTPVWVKDGVAKPIDVQVVLFPEIIPAGLAKRVKGRTDASVQRINVTPSPGPPNGRVEFRVLRFQIAKD